MSNRPHRHVFLFSIVILIAPLLPAGNGRAAETAADPSSSLTEPPWFYTQ